MQPSLSLIAASISAAIALSPLGDKSVQAASMSESHLRSRTDDEAAVLRQLHENELLGLTDSAQAGLTSDSSPIVLAEVTITQHDTADHEEADSTVAAPDADESDPRMESDANPDEDATLSHDEQMDDGSAARDADPSSESDTLAQDILDDEPPAPDLADPVESEDAVEAEDVIDEDILELETEFPTEEVEVDIEVDPDRLDGLTDEESSAVLDAPNSVPPEAFGLDDDESPVSVPEYLNSPANPLNFPTQPEEIELSGTQPITLEQAIEIARRNSTALQEALLQLEQSQAALREAQAAYLPTLDASTTLNRVRNNGFQPVTEAIDPNNPLAGTTTSIQSFSSEATSLSGEFSLSYDIFTSGRRSALVRSAEEQVRLQELQVEVVSEQLRLDVIQDYYDLQETDELVRIAAQSLEESLQSLRDAQALERAGVGTRFDVLQAEVEAANSRQDLIQALSDQEIARRQLSQQLNSAESINLSAADPVDIAGYWDVSLEDSIALAYQNRAELEQQLAQRDISEQQRRAQLSALGPQLSAFAQYGFDDLLDESESTSDSETYAIGLQASIRLYDGGAARAAARQEELNMALAENAFEETQRTIRFQVEQSYSAMRSNLENIQTALLAVETATEALRLARLRFQAGVGTQTDVLQAQTDLTRAEVNRLQAVLGYNRALAQLQRSVSNLPDSDLSDRP